MKKSREMEAGRPMTRLERARVVREAVLAISATHGHWQELQLGAAHQDRTTRVWEVDSGQGWTALVDTRFTRPAPVLRRADLHASAVAGLNRPQTPDQCIDVYWGTVGKVVSISRTDGVDRLIGFTAGPWEAAFGLPEQAWPPAIARRFQKSAA